MVGEEIMISTIHGQGNPAPTKTDPRILLGNHHRYLNFNQVLKEKFGERVYRVTLNAGLTCPNIDGTRAKGGCTFCNDDYLLANSWHKKQNLDEQMRYGIDYIKHRHGAGKFLAYFQNGTNTHAPAADLKKIFEESLRHENVVGLAISTRPDCLGRDVLDVLSELGEKTYLWVELGLQSAQNHILEKINRAHSVEEFAEAVHKLNERKILTCAHMILGLPEETPEEMLAGADFLNALPVSGIKIHNLFVTEYTALAKQYREGNYTPLTLEEYVTLCVDYVERLRPDIIIHRLNAHGPERLTVAPDWSINKMATVNAIHNELEKRDAWQGKKWAAKL